MSRNKIHLISPGYPRPCTALQVQNRDLEQHSVFSSAKHTGLGAILPTGGFILGSDSLNIRKTDLHSIMSCMPRKASGQLIEHRSMLWFLFSHEESM